jgi:hypothetical protein
MDLTLPSKDTNCQIGSKSKIQQSLVLQEIYLTTKDTHKLKIKVGKRFARHV